MAKKSNRPYNPSQATLLSIADPVGFAQKKLEVPIPDFALSSGYQEPSFQAQRAFPNEFQYSPSVGEAAANMGYMDEVGQAQDEMGAGAPDLSLTGPAMDKRFLELQNQLKTKPNPNRDYFKEASERNAKNEKRNTRTENLYLAPEEYKGLEQQAKGISPEGVVDPEAPYQQQLKGLKDTQNMLALYGEHAPSDLDYSPLVALVDQWTGSKLRSSYKPPEKFRDTYKELIGAQKQIADQRGKMANDLRDSIKNMKTGTTSDLVSQLLATKIALEEGQRPMPLPPQARGLSPNASLADLRIKEKDARDSFNKTMAPLEDRYQQLSTMQTALASGDFTQLGAVLSLASKNVGAESGVLTDRDIQRTLPSTIATSVAGLEAYLSNNANVKIPPSVTAGLRKLVGVAMKNAHDRYSNTLKRQVGQFKGSKSFANVDVEDIARPANQALGDIKSWATENGMMAGEKKAQPSFKEIFMKSMEAEKAAQKGKK